MLALQRKEILTQYNLDVPKDILLSEISQSPKDKYCRFHLYEVPRRGKLLKTESRMVVVRGWRERGE
jgi:hypothetical protein